MACHTTDMYPIQFSVDYPEGPRNRLTVLLRIVLSIPILIVSILLELVSISIGLIFFPTFLMIVFRKKYPRWWFDHNLEALRFLSRVIAYAALYATNILPRMNSRRFTLISYIRTLGS